MWMSGLPRSAPVKNMEWSAVPSCPGPRLPSRLSSGDLQVIARIAVFRDLKLETVERIVAPATAITLKAHESLFRQGDPATAFFIVVEGYVKLFRITPSGDEAVIRIMTRGDSVAEATAITGAPFLVFAESVSNARVIRIPADHVVRCIRESPDIALAMIASTSQHVHPLMQQVEQLKARSGLQRVAEFFVSLSSVERGPCEITLPYDKVLIAGWLGLEPESLSRAFAKLKSLGVEVHASHVSIKDIARLHQLATDDRAAVRGT